MEEPKSAIRIGPQGHWLWDTVLRQNPGPKTSASPCWLSGAGSRLVGEAGLAGETKSLHPRREKGLWEAMRSHIGHF